MLAVVIPTFNHPETLREALMSLTLQNYKMFITIVVDDCSTEDLQPVINEFSNKLQLKYIKKEKNQGQGLARQTGIDWAYENRCDYVTFMDQDDLLYPNAVQDMYKTAKAKLAQVLYSPIIQEDLKTQKDNIIDNNQNWVWTHGKCYSLHFLKQNNIRFSENVRYNEDGNFNFQVKEIVDKIIYIQSPCYRWRDNQESITRKKGHIFNTICYHNIVNGYVEAIETLLEKNQLKNGVYAVTALLYNHYENYMIENQINKASNFENIVILQDKINKILGNDIIINDFKKEKTPRKIMKLISSGYIGIKQDQPLIMYPHNFYQWLEQFENGIKIREILSQ